MRLFDWLRESVRRSVTDGFRAAIEDLNSAAEAAPIGADLVIDEPKALPPPDSATPKPLPPPDSATPKPRRAKK
jgi:hypothetical protein